ncbi:DEKNAAC103152 [Brettanomyces naardenensis]|uniref:DEKNAAC103152 n=1 Tax=Brettanomyces naardenensis TaxID=13370 RepID=A0A448YMI1_BRENA|nr:DEKNAAC103152 [Brettanomyces naardenensis]
MSSDDDDLSISSSDDVLFGSRRRPGKYKNTYTKKKRRKVVNGGSTLDRFLGSMPNPGRVKTGISAQLGFSLDDAMKNSEIPDSVKQIDQIIEQETRVEQMLEEEDREDRKRKQIEEKSIHMIREQLDGSFVDNPANSSYLEILKSTLLDPLESIGLFDYYFFRIAGNFGKTEARRAHKELRERILSGGGITGDQELVNALSCLSEETNPDVVSRYGFQIDATVDAPSLESFLVDLGCNKKELVEASSKEFKLRLDNKERFPSLALNILKLQKVIGKVESGHFDLLARVLILCCVDRRINRPDGCESIIVDSRRTTGLEIAIQMILELVKQDATRLVTLVEKTLDRYPFLWFRFINNLVDPVVYGRSVSMRLTFFRMQCMLRFICGMDFNDEGERKVINLEMDDEGSFFHLFVEYLDSLRGLQLNGTILKDCKYDEGKEVSRKNYLINGRAYENAKLRVLGIERICMKYMKGGENREAYGRLGRCLKEIGHRYFFKFRGIICPPITDCVGVLERLGNELANEGKE